jgi:hypothetical protein
VVFHLPAMAEDVPLAHPHNAALGTLVERDHRR